MITVMNRLRQPLVLDLENGESLHFLAKSTIDISTEQLNSKEVKSAIDRGDLIVVRMN